MHLLALALAAMLSLPLDAKCPPSYDEWDSPACDDGNPIDGYWGNHGTWVPGLIRDSSWFMTTPLVFEGKAVWYSPYLMEATAEYRGLDLSKYKGGVSGTTCADIGLSYWLKRQHHEWEGPFLVVDCARRGDLYGVIVTREEAVEVSWELKNEWGIDGPIWVRVSKLPPQETDLHERVYNLRDWFLDRVEFYPVAMEVTLDRKPLYHSPNFWRFYDVWYRGTIEGLVPMEGIP